MGVGDRKEGREKGNKRERRRVRGREGEREKREKYVIKKEGKTMFSSVL